MIIKHNKRLVDNKDKLYNDLLSFYFTEENLISRQNKAFNFKLSKLQHQHTEFQDRYAEEVLQLLNTVYNYKQSAITPNSYFAYVSNKDNYDSYVHNHEDVGGFTAVYYLTMPIGSGGEIEFYDTDQTTLMYKHKPIEDDILIFNSLLYHRPMPIDSNKFRICITLEISVKDNDG